MFKRMTLIVPGGLLLAAAAFLSAQAPAGQPAGQPAGGTTFKTGTRLVVLDVSVNNDKGAVRGLTKEDFILEDKGKKVEIAIFGTAEAGKSSVPAQALTPGIVSNKMNAKGEMLEAATVILYDRINTAASDQAFVRGQVLKILTGLKDTDKIGFYSLGFNLNMVRDFNEDAAPLVRMAKRLQDGKNADGLTGEDLTLYKRLTDALSPMQEMQNQARVNITQAAFPMIGRHLNGVPGRKSLVWVVSAFPLTYGNAAERRRQDEAEVQSFINNLTEASVTVYTVDPGGNGASFNTYGAAPAVAEGTMIATGGATRGRASTAAAAPADTPAPAANSLTGNQTFQMLANATGGKAFRNSNDISVALRDVIDSGSFTYQLGFYPDEKTMDDKAHKLEVKLVKKPATDKAKVAHRKEYLAWGPKSGPDVKARPEMDDLMADTLDATGIGLVAGAALEPAKPGFHKMSVRVSISDMQFQQRGDQWAGSFDMAVGLDGQKGGAVETFSPVWSQADYLSVLQQGLIIDKLIQTNGTNGVFHVILQDKATGNVGSFRLPFASK